MVCSRALASWRVACHFARVRLHIRLSNAAVIVSLSVPSAPEAAVFSEAFLNGTISRLFAEKLKSPKTIMSALCGATDGGNSDAGTACVGRSRSAPLAAGFSVCLPWLPAMFDRSRSDGPWCSCLRA